MRYHEFRLSRTIGSDLGLSRRNAIPWRVSLITLMHHSRILKLSVALMSLSKTGVLPSSLGMSSHLPLALHIHQHHIGQTNPHRTTSIRIILAPDSQGPQNPPRGLLTCPGEPPTISPTYSLRRPRPESRITVRYRSAEYRRHAPHLASSYDIVYFPTEPLNHHPVLLLSPSPCYRQSLSFT